VKQRIFSVCVGMTILFFMTVVSAANISFAEVVDHVDRRAHTRMNIDEYWKRVKGKEVTWSGEVYDVESGKSQARILVIDRSRPLYKGYNIRVITHVLSKASTLKKGQPIRFKGLLNTYHSKDVGAVIDVSEATIF